ncbi:MAG: HAMP domain-containing sensor histidine kinase [Candidatus Thermoplasmatota archaeon]
MKTETPPETAAAIAELARLREMDAFRTRFLNMAAHELNTPLTPLRLQMHLLLSGGLGALDEKQRQAVEVANRNVGRLSAVVKEMLEVARMEGGGLRFHVETFALADAVKEAVESFDEVARGIGVTLKANVPPEIIVKTDRQRLVQVFLNLISNALKFTPAGGQVTLSARSSGNHLTLDVKDTGVGLTQEQISRLFQPFTQVHEDVMTVEGAGLGLYICRGLVEAMGGTIVCLSDGPGKGSTFRIVMPLSHEEVISMLAPHALPREDPREAAQRRLRELI